MRLELKKAVRTAQTYFPALRELKFEAERALRRAQRRPFDEDFYLLAAMYDDPEGVWLDIGANRGQSIDAIRLFQPSAKIVAFEPSSLMVSVLRRRFAEDLDVRVEGFGLGAEDGEFELHTPSYRGWVFDGLASFDLENASGWLKSRVIGFDPAKLTICRESCVVRRLDGFALKANFIKIDVQGLEEQVLVGGAETLARDRPPVLLEYNGKRAAPRVLLDLGYAPYRYEAGRLTKGLAGEKNTFFFCGGELERIDRSKVDIVGA